MLSGGFGLLGDTVLLAIRGSVKENMGILPEGGGAAALFVVDIHEIFVSHGDFNLVRKDT